ncbi:MAG: efflux RND transporter periplasmic adaptor subunit [Pseudomonadota bacterium]
MRTKKFLLGLPFLMVLSLLEGCSVGEASATQAQAAEPNESVVAVPVEVESAVLADIYATYDATSNIDSEGDAPVVARVAGDVVEILVEEGDWVSKGQALARLDGERMRLEMLSAKADLEKVRGEYRRYLDLNERGLVSKSMFDGLKYDLEALEATYKLKKLNYGYATVRATIDGFVSDRSIKLGQNVNIDEALFRITDTSELVSYLQIPQTELAKFDVGQIVSVSVDSMPDTAFAAEVIRISPTIDTRNGTFRATVFIDNETGMLAPGMFARFSVAYEKHSKALTIPAQALIVEDEQTWVYVMQDDEVSRRAVDVGIESGDVAEVLNGLSEGEQVVTVGQGSLKDGSKVLAQTDDVNKITG